MSLHTFTQRAEKRREARYLKRKAQMSGWLPGLRNQRSRRGLVAIFLASLLGLLVSGIFLALSITDVLSGAWSLGWMIMTFILLISWTTLNITVDAIDGAPMSCLDEYERAQIESLRSLVYRCFIHFGLVLLFVLVFLGTYVMSKEPSWGHYVPYFTGIFMLIPFLALTSLPTLVFAWTLPDDDAA